jgi:hypothetical protein
MKTSKILRNAALIGAVIGTLAGCARVETGNIGILRHWGGEISMTGVTGFNWMILDSMIAEIDTTETRIPVDNLRPADSNGVLLDDLDIIVSYRLDPLKVSPFYIQTKELDEFVDDTGHKITTVGIKILENIMKHAVQEQTKQQALGDLAGNLRAYENAIMRTAQEELNKGYPGVFELIRVNVNHFVPPTAILEQANKTAALRGEKERNKQELELIVQRTELERSKALVEGRALASTAKETGMTPEQLIAWKNVHMRSLHMASEDRSLQPLMLLNLQRSKVIRPRSGC